MLRLFASVKLLLMSNWLQSSEHVHINVEGAVTMMVPTCFTP